MGPKTPGPRLKSGQQTFSLHRQGRGLATKVQSQIKACLFRPSVSWYKDGEQILTSVPGYIIMKDRDLRIIANEFNEGVYTCRVHRRGDIVSANSWAIRLKPEEPSNS